MKICAACGEENPDRARFCIACGEELAEETAQRFRKVITLLFCDVIDSAALGEELDAATLSTVMTTYHDAMAPIIERHGGTVAKFIGDAIMSVFGVPVLHEDDALRACRAALELQERLVEVNAELEARFGVTLTTRTGINTGTVSGVGVARAQNFVAGDAANTAARLQQNATGGQILLGESTYRLVRDGVGVEVLPPIPMKGKAEPVPVYALREVLAEAEALTRRHDAPLVGRERELAALREAFARVAEDRQSRLALLIADAGMGKSRLVAELWRALEDEATILSGRCVSYGEGITFLPVVDVVRGAAQIEDEDAPASARAKLAEVALEDDQIVERVAPLVGLSDAQFEIPELFWGIRRLLETISERRPLVVVLDDIHWAAPTLLDLIEYLLESITDSAVLLVCPTRPDLLDIRPDWRERERTIGVTLEPLSDEEAGRVIDNMLGGLGIAGDVRARIVAAADGNPLFVEQMLSMLIDDGVLRRTNGRLEPVGDLSDLIVPPSINALLAARVDRLPRHERAVVDPAAVVGLVFPAAAVEELAAAGGQIRASLAALTDKQLVREAEESSDGDDYRFNHVLIRDAAYESLLKEVRAGLHERTAEWVERFYGERGRELEFEEILGYHLERAHRYRAELGPVDDHGRELAARAAKRLASAGTRAFERSDAQAAANLLGRAVDLLAPDDLTRLRLLPDLADALTTLGEFPRASEVLDEAVERAGELGETTLEAEAQLVRLFVRGFATDEGWTEQVLVAAEPAMAVLERAEHHAGLAKGWRLLASVHGTACRYGEAASAVQQALLHARLAGDRRQELRNATAYAQALLLGPTPVDEAIAECERILDQTGGDRRARAYVLRMLAPLQAMAGMFGEARASYVSSRVLFEELGVTMLAASVSLESADVELLAGDLSGAERELRRDHDVLEGLGERYFLSSISGLLAKVVYARGRYDEAEELAAKAGELATDDDLAAQMLSRVVRAKLAARAGASDAALALAHEAVDYASRTDSPVMRADALVDLAEVLRLLGEPDEAVLEQAVGLYEQKGNGVAAAAARALTARADEPVA